MLSKFKRHLMVATSTVALAGLVAACSSTAGSQSSDSSSSSPQAATSDTVGGGGGGSGDAGKTLLIGVSSPRTGPAASYGISGDSMVAYLKAKNDEGGVAGYTFDFKYLDNNGTVSGGALAAQTLLADDPFALALVTTPPFNGSVEIIKSQTNPPPIFATVSGAAIDASGLENVFGVLTNYVTEAQYVLRHMVNEDKHQKVALFYDPSFADETVAPLEEAAKSLGADLVSSIAVAAEDTNMTPYIQQALSAGADSALIMAHAQSAGYMLKAARGQGVDIPFYGFSGTLDPVLIQTAGADAAEGFKLDGAYPPVDSGADSAEVQRFREVTAKYAPDAGTYFGTMGWQMGAVLAAGVQSVADSGKEMNRENFIGALYALSGQEVGFTTITLTPDDHNTLIKDDGLSMYQVSGGTFVPLGG